LFSVAILAGGLATRLRPITEKIPKSLVDLNGEPFIAHQLRLLHGKGIRRAVLCVGFLGEKIREIIGDGQSFGVQVDYSFDGEKLLGTAGAISKALPLLGPEFFVLYGDSYLVCDYRAVQEEYLAQKKLALMTVFRNAGQWDTSNVEFSNGQLLAYDKKNWTPRMHFIDYGLGVFSEEAFARVPSDEPFDLAQLYMNLLGEGQLAGMEVPERFYEIGSPAGLQETAQFLATQGAVR
jgi:N-acetyl-alpha-D-muramate 1-phosphate uridylyltransferase